MLRGSRNAALLLAPAVPRGVWDPKHHNHKHVDSYAQSIAERRIWPAKKWSVGVEPRVKDDWNKFSLRNLAYQYNAKLRACSNFPEMIPVYTEMKIRGAKMDTDTMTVMLSRGARFTPITAVDLFLLFDEMVAHGAKPDIAVIEVLHTVLDHAPHDVSSTWKEAKRLQLIAEYDSLCADEVEKLGDKQMGALLASQVARYRKNIAALNGRLTIQTWKQYVAVIPTVEQLFEELANFLQSYVPPNLAEDFPRTEMRFNTMTSIPHLYRHNALSRPTNKPVATATSSTGKDEISFADRMAYRSLFADDIAINDVMLSALERFIDVPLETKLPRSDETALLLLFEKFVKSTGVLITADLAAQMMEVCKFATTFGNEAAATRILQMAHHGSAVPNSPYRMNWKLAESGIDGRVLGRFLAARNPWGPLRFDISNNGKLADFRALDVNSAAADEAAAAAEEAAATATTDGIPADSAAEEAAAAAKKKVAKEVAQQNAVTYTSAAVRERWESVQKAVRDCGALDFDAYIAAQQPINVDTVMEVFTGQACFIRNMFLEERYPPTEEHLRAAGQYNTDPDSVNSRGKKGGVASRNMTVEACEAVFKALSGLKRNMDMKINEARGMSALSTYGTSAADVAANVSATTGPVELVPELECWESMLTVSKHMMDFLLSRRDQNGQAGRQMADDLFKQVAAFRHQLLEESREKYDGRFKILWLQEM